MTDHYKTIGNALHEISESATANQDELCMAMVREALSALKALREQAPVAECVDDGDGGVYYRTINRHVGMLYAAPVTHVPETDFGNTDETLLRQALEALKNSSADWDKDQPQHYAAIVALRVRLGT